MKPEEETSATEKGKRKSKAEAEKNEEEKLILPSWVHVISTGEEKAALPSCVVQQPGKPPAYHICPTQDQIDDLIWLLNKAKMEEKYGVPEVKNKEDIVEVQPCEVVFPHEVNRVSLTTMQLSNKSDDETVNFQFDMTQHRMGHYRIKPESGVLQPQTTIKIKVGRKPVPVDAMEIWQMTRSEDVFVLRITKTGEVVQTVHVRVITPKLPRSRPENTGEDFSAYLHFPDAVLRAGSMPCTK